MDGARIWRYQYSLPGRPTDLLLTMPTLSAEEIDEVEAFFALVIRGQRRNHQPLDTGPGATAAGQLPCG